MMKAIFGNFLKGILILAPMLVTGWVIFVVFTKIDGLLGIETPGVGFLVTLVFIIVVGSIASNIVFTRIFGWFERAITRLPVVKLMYFSIKDLINSFVGEKKMFNRPVMVTLGHLPFGTVIPPSTPEGDIKVLGFITSEALDFLPEAGDRVAVYVPQSYNVGGNLLLIPKDRITPLASAENAKILAFIVSGGVARGNT